MDKSLGPPWPNSMLPNACGAPVWSRRRCLQQEQ
jgi:hypothetical protein